MPALSVSVDGILLATVSTGEYNIVTVRASGDVVNKNFVGLEVVASYNPEIGDSIYHIYVSEYQLLPGQIVTIQMLESALTSHKGKTIDECYPDESPVEKNFDFTLTTDIYDELRKKPRLREKFTLRVESTNGSIFLGDTDPGIHGFSFYVLWDSWSPESSRVSLHSHTLKGLETREPMTNYFKGQIQPGDSILFEPIT